jgi:GMP synthase-like glutamine amidotransferase
MKPVLIRQHGASGPPAIFGEWLRDRGLPAVVHPAYLGIPTPDPGDFAFVASLGSANSPSDTAKPEVMEELRFLDRAIAEDVPVLGLCFGGQALATVLGGSVETATRPELGWHSLSTRDPDQIPAGPWLQWHYDRFIVPDGGDELASSSAGSQAFRAGVHLGVQFHPESRIEQVAVWAHKDAERLARHGVTDGLALLEAGRANQAAAVEAAYQLFDAFWARASEERSA